MQISLQVVRQSLYTCSNKMCRSIWRDMANNFFKPWLEEHSVDQSQNIALLDFTSTPLPLVAYNKWQHLSITSSLSF